MKTVDDRQQFRIHGMDCAEEVAVLKREIGPVVGGEERLAFDILRGKMTVLSKASIGSNAVIEAVNRTGMRAEAWTDPAPGAANDNFWRRGGRTLLTAISGVLLIAAFLIHGWIAGSLSKALGSEGMGIAHTVPVLVKLLYALAILAGAWFVFPKAWFAVQRLRPDMNLLMALAVAGAAGIGEWFEAATVAFLFALSLTLESWSVGRARRAVASLLAIAPAIARVLHDDGREEELPLAHVLVGMRFLVRPGERIALDGVILHGTSEVNQAPITGESLTVPKDVGAQVFAGTINGNGALEVEATKLAGETTLAQIIRMVGEAQSRRAPSEQWVDRFAQVYTPAILGLAVVIAVVPPLFLAGSWADWFYRSLVLLVIGCPCALVISTPVSIVASLAAAARNGILVKGGIHIETPARLRAIALDKTGTITAGKPQVVEVVPMNGHTETGLLERIGAMEAHSDHPLARAIVSFIEHRGIAMARADQFQVITGKGATGNFNGRAYWLGSHRYLEERGQETPEVHDRLELLSGSGRTVVVVGNEQHVCGFIALADTIRPGAREVVSELRRAGSDTAIEAADVALMSDDLGKVPWLIRHSHRTLGIIRQNICLALAVKAVFVFLTFLGYASLWAAIAADMGVSLIVIANALRLLKLGR
jgi:Cd2+/Zn2+-exporting ATPase